MNTRHLLRAARAIIVITSFLVWPQEGVSAPGDLDPTFGTGGTIVGIHQGVCKDLAIQSDGKILAVGYSGPAQGPYTDIRLVRLLPDGALDLSFGTGGEVLTDSGGLSDNPDTVLVQPDGKILVGGQADAGGTGPDFAVWRYHADGSLDSSFGTAGMVTTSFSPGVAYDDTAEALFLQPDGKIVAAGHFRDEFFVERIGIARYNTDGSLDSSFGIGGRVTTVFGTQDAAFGALLQPDGKILVVGPAGTPFNFAVVRYLTDGTLDSTFGSDGIVTTDFGSSDVAWEAFLQDDQKIVVGGYSQIGGNSIALARYDSTGVLDATFGSSGKVVLSAPASPFATAIVPTLDGAFLAIGGNGVAPNYNFAVVRFLSDGTLDSSFGTAGVATTSFTPGDDEARSAVVDSAGRIIVCGWASTAGASPVKSFALARYLGDQCGDGVVSGIEDCDDGNTIAGDCCSASCESEASSVVCRGSTDECDLEETCTGSSGTCPADQKKEDGTSCDDLNLCTVGEACVSGECQFVGVEPFCGDGAVQPCEQCDLGAQNGEADSGCAADCTLVGICVTPSGSVGVPATNCTIDTDCPGGQTCCGNAIPTAPETCDDGNLHDGDCCSATCRAETPGTCVPSYCAEAKIYGPHVHPAAEALTLVDTKGDGTMEKWTKTGEFIVFTGQGLDADSERFGMVISEAGPINVREELFRVELDPGVCPSASTCFAEKPLGKKWTYKDNRRVGDPTSSCGLETATFLKSLGTKWKFKMKGKSDANDGCAYTFPRPTGTLLREDIVVGDDCVTSLLDCRVYSGNKRYKCVTR